MTRATTDADRYTAPPLDLSATFPTADAAWFWASAQIMARRESTPAGRGSVGPRCCTADDLVLVVENLYRVRRLTLAHMRVLLEWGERGVIPMPRTHAPVGDMALWREAMAVMGPMLRVRKIVK